MKAVFVFVLFAISALCCTCTAQPPTTNDAKIEQVLKDWKARYDRLKSVRYKLVGTRESFGGPLVEGAEAPLKGSRPVKATLLLDLVKLRYRLDEDMGVPSRDRKRFIRLISTSAFDGKSYQSAIPRENEERNSDTPDLFIAKGNLNMMRLDVYLEPPFLAHGIVPTEESPLGPGRFPTEHERDDFQFSGVASERGRHCLLLRTPPASTTPAITDEVWIDAQMDSAVVRKTRWSGKNPSYRTDITYQQTSSGWLPQTWSVVNSVGREVRTITKLTVDSAELNPSIQDDDFALPLRPNMVVMIDDFPGGGKGLDPAQPARTIAKVESSGDLVVEKREGFRTLDGVQLPPEKNRKAWWWIGGVVLAMSLGFLLWRRKQRHLPGSSEAAMKGG